MATNYVSYRTCSLGAEVSQDPLDRFLPPLHLSLCHFDTEWDNAMYMHDATTSCKLFGEDQSSNCGGDDSNRNCIMCSRRGLAYFVEYLQTYWTEFRNLFTI